MRVLTNDGLPIKMWLDYLEDGAEKQAINMSKLPVAFHHIAIMPDSHQGYGMPIGGVLALDNHISPNAVGCDVGCGVCAIKTNLSIELIPRPELEKVVESIKSVIPVGFNWNAEPDRDAMPKLISKLPVVEEQYDRATYQLSSLGGGNHFIELQKDDQGQVWIMIHSGSRNLGKQVADYYNKIANEINERTQAIPTKWDLSYLPVDSEEGQNYLKEMQYCVDFALANRKRMMEKIKIILETQFKGISFEPMINIAHNYANLENHFGEDVYVHRKGATSARLGEVGIVPGSQGTCSYIVEGKGNPESFESCSHGAGRVMGRGKARRELNLEEEAKSLNDKGIIHSLTSQKSLDEAPSAYKNIEVVMKNQKDLVDIKVKLEPLAVIKG